MTGIVIWFDNVQCGVITHVYTVEFHFEAFVEF